MYTSITDAAAALRSGETTSVDLVREGYALADAHDAELGVYLARFDETALAAAEKADAELASGVDRGPLHGIPLGVKDIITTEEGETTAQSLVLDRSWGVGDAPVVARLRAAGAVITGKLTTMEYAIGMPDVTKPFPLPRNPWNSAHYSGGSSSGTGGGVAAGFVLGGLGTDTGGSVRWPAAVDGITGMKQTFGRVPKVGCVPLGYSYDNIGPMARSAQDCAAMLSVMAGHDPRDACSVDRPVDDYLSGLTGSLEGMRIGLDTLKAHSGEFWDPALDGLLADAVTALEAAGATVVEVDLPLYEELKTITMSGFCAEAYAYHRPDLQSRWPDFAAGTRAAVIEGALTAAGDYVQMQRVRRVGQRLLGALYADAGIDLVITPTTSEPAPLFDDMKLADLIPSLHTPYWNAVGNPAMSVPMGFTAAGLPMGLQLCGKPFAEATVFAAGHAFQQQTDWHTRVPAMITDSAALAA